VDVPGWLFRSHFPCSSLCVFVRVPVVIQHFPLMSVLTSGTVLGKFTGHLGKSASYFDSISCENSIPNYGTVGVRFENIFRCDSVAV
jgi:hypothetical protein